MAPRPGLEPGTYGLTETQAPQNTYVNQWLTSKKYKRVIFRVIEKQLHISTVWYFEQSNCLDFVHFTTGKVSLGLGLQALTVKSSTPQSGLELDILNSP